jgi:hypothetical protein
MPHVRYWLYLSTKLLLHEAGTGRERVAERPFSFVESPLAALSLDYNAALCWKYLSAALVIQSPTSDADLK